MNECYSWHFISPPCLVLFTLGCTTVAGLWPFRVLVPGQEQDGVEHQPGRLLILPSSEREGVTQITRYKEFCSDTSCDDVSTELWTSLLPNWLVRAPGQVSTGKKKWEEVGALGKADASGMPFPSLFVQSG